MNNIAFIDGQNLHLGTAEDGWKVDNKRFRVYLKDKYKVDEAYYFMGCISNKNQLLYQNLQRAGFIVIFREHNEFLEGKKKGNVDTDIVFEIMKSLIEEEFGKIILVSGDGDYKKTVDYLLKKDKFEKILFPNFKKASSLYKKMGNNFFISLSTPEIRTKIEYQKEKGG